MALIAEIKKLDLQNGDILMLRCLDLENPEDMALMVYETLQEVGLDDVLVLMCPYEITIDALDEEIMGKWGWVRTRRTHREVPE